MTKFTQDFLTHVIHPVIEVLGFDDGEELAEVDDDVYMFPSEALLLGTALAETSLEQIVQYGGGPAVGYFQIEPATYEDILGNWLVGERAREITPKIYKVCCLPYMPDAGAMIWHPRFAACMCRLHYRRQPRYSDKLALPDTIEGIAEYWGTYYNTSLGKGSVEHFLETWQDR